MSYFERCEELKRRIRKQAAKFVYERIKNPTWDDFLYTENAMMVGAHLEMSFELEENAQMEESIRETGSRAKS